MIHEWCKCGASIKTWRYATVRAWRTDHLHTLSEPGAPTGPSGIESRLLETAGERDYEVAPLGAEVPIVVARIGFSPNP